MYKWHLVFLKTEIVRNLRTFWIFIETEIAYKFKKKIKKIQFPNLANVKF